MGPWNGRWNCICGGAPIAKGEGQAEAAWPGMGMPHPTTIISTPRSFCSQ